MAQRNTVPPQRLSNLPPSGSLVSSARTRVFPVLTSDTEWTLASLGDALGPPDPTIAPLLLRTFTEDDLAKYGNKVASERVLRATPTIVSSTLAVLHSLDEANLGLVHLTPDLFAVIVAEAAKIPPLAARVAAASKRGTVSQTAWNATRTQSRRRALAARDLLTRAVTHALGATRASVVKATAGNAPDDKTLASGMNDLAALIETTLATGDANDRAAFAHFNVDASAAARLRKAAAELESVGGAPTPQPYNALQRVLDLQEGRVLALLDMVVGAMREARAANKAIPLPELGPLRSWFMPRRTRKKKAPSEG